MTMDETRTRQCDEHVSSSDDDDDDEQPLSNSSRYGGGESRASSLRFGCPAPTIIWPVTCRWLSCRTVLSLMAMFGFFNVYALRANLSVALVAMLNDTRNGTWTFDWRSDSSVKGVVLGSFFYGYITTQVLGGWLAQRYGGKHVYGFGVLMTALLSLFSPLAVNISVWLLVALRIAEGICEGVTFPAMHSLLGRWAPPMERSILVGITYSGPYLGTVVSLLLSGILSDTLGWPSVFYFFGIVAVAWWLLWIVLVYDTPDSHPCITMKEKQYIEKSLAISNKLPPVSLKLWLRILVSIPAWAIAIGHVCNNFGLYTLLTSLPTFFQSVYGFDIKSNGLVSSLPYLGLWIITLLSGRVADILRAKGILSTTNTRRLFNSLGFLAAGLFLALTGYSRTWKEAVLFVCLSVSCSGFAQAGFAVSHLDIAPRYAGVLMSFTNTLATIPGFVGPALAEGIAHSENDIVKLREEWRAVFFLLASTYLFGAIVYAVLVSGEKQSWADGYQAKRDEYEFHQLNSKQGQPDGVFPAVAGTTESVLRESD